MSESFSEKLSARLFKAHLQDGREGEAAEKLLTFGYRAGAAEWEFDTYTTAYFLLAHFHQASGLRPEQVEGYSLVDLAAMVPEECGEPVGEPLDGEPADSKADSVQKVAGSAGHTIPIVRITAKATSIEWNGLRHQVDLGSAKAFQKMIDAKGQPVGIGECVRKPSEWLEKLEAEEPELRALVARGKGNSGYRTTVFD